MDHRIAGGYLAWCECVIGEIATSLGIPENLIKECDHMETTATAKQRALNLVDQMIAKADEASDKMKMAIDNEEFAYASIYRQDEIVFRHVAENLLASVNMFEVDKSEAAHNETSDTESSTALFDTDKTEAYKQARRAIKLRVSIELFKCDFYKLPIVRCRYKTKTGHEHGLEYAIDARTTTSIGDAINKMLAELVDKN